MKEGDDARTAVAEAGRRTTSRRDLARNERFSEISPEIGELDEAAMERYMEEDPDAALSLLAQLSGATDERLRQLARRLAGRIALGVARHHHTRRRGVGRLRPARADDASGDLDLDASIEAIAAARASGSPLRADDLVVRAWERPGTALSLVIDRSGSMSGPRLAAAAVAIAAVIYRQGDDCSVIAFSDEVIVLKSQGEHRAPDDVVSDLLALRGHGVTDVGLALRAARTQLDRSRSGRRIAVLVSDCRVTQGGDPSPHAAGIDEIAIIAPADDTADAEALAAAIGARWVPLGGPSDVPDAVSRALQS